MLSKTAKETTGRLILTTKKKIKHLAMQSAITNICEGMSHSNELAEFECGTVIG